MALHTANSKESLAIDAGCEKSSPRQLLSQVPDEILENIFFEDVLSDKDLCAFALVNRKFSKMVQASLYSEVEILWPTMKFILFKRTLLNCPQLATYVWKLAIRTPENKDDEEFFQDLRQLLKTMPALRVLELPADFRYKDELASLFGNPMSHLRFLLLGNYAKLSSIHLVVEAFSLPQIKRLCIWFNRDDNLANAFSSDIRMDQFTSHLRSSLYTEFDTSFVKELILEGWPDSVILETELLRIPRALEKLDFHFEYSGRFTPKTIVDSLVHLCSTLVFLNLSYCWLRDNVDEPVADFSCFAVLKTLIVDEELCLEKWSEEVPDEWCSFYNRLPSTLMTLEMKVGKSAWWVSNRLESQLRKGYKWVLELAENKLTYSSSLEKVVLRDCLWPRPDWKYPEDLLKAFETARINLLLEGICADS